jgi:hypothetical protein
MLPIGYENGNLKITGYDKNGAYVCKCECGSEITKSHGRFIRIKSCGCRPTVKGTRVSDRSVIGDFINTLVHKTWNNLRHKGALCDSWKDISVFAKWYDENNVSGDVNLLLRKGETTWSPETTLIKKRSDAVLRNRKSVGKTSKYKGVHFDKSRDKWVASHKFESSKNMKRFHTEEEAALYYNYMVLKFH